MANINENHEPRVRYEHLLALMSSGKFLDMTGPSTDIPYYVCPFRVEETKSMYQIIKQLISALELKQIKVLEINLYSLTIEHLQSIHKLNQLIMDETKTARETFFKSLSGLTDPRDFFCDLILAKINAATPDIIFLTGVGEVYPYIRSHQLLNTLDSRFTEKPLVLFFPGKYETDDVKGSNLTLFGVLDDKYYRAFNIYRCDP